MEFSSCKFEQISVLSFREMYFVRNCDYKFYFIGIYYTVFLILVKIWKFVILRHMSNVNIAGNFGIRI